MKPTAAFQCIVLKARPLLTLAAIAVCITGCPEWFDQMVPRAAFSLSPAGDYQVQFTDSSDPGLAPITAWDWDFGDGTSATDQNPLHTYSQAGVYSVRMTITTALGSDFQAVQLNVTEPSEGPQFTSADTSSYGYGPRVAFEGGEGEGEAQGGAADDADVPRDVVEPDVIRQDGDTLYILNQYRGLTVVDLTDREILAQVPTEGFPRDLYIRDGRAYVLVSNARNFIAAAEDAVSFTVQARLQVIDIADPANPAILSSFDLEGDLVDSRLVGDVLYAICAEYSWYWVETDVVFKQQTSASWVTSVNVADPENPFQADQVSFEGMGNVIHATNSAIFVANSTWGDLGTSIRYVDISDPAGAITVAGAANVRGYVADKFKMDAWNGVLRVVSNAFLDTRQVYITTIDLADPDNLVQLAETQLERAAGETLFATRFDGDVAYVVTYLQTDPLFVIDLSDPENPTVTGELEVPGWSLHIEPRGDRLVALGIDDVEGRRASVSLYDVADPAAPALVDRVNFGQNWSSSSAFSDYKAFTVLDDLLIVPVSGWGDLRGSYERLHFISWDPGGLHVRGYVDLDGGIQRSFEYDTLFYGVTTEQLAIIDGSDLDQPEIIDTVTLAENVVDFLEFSPTLSAEIISRNESGEIVVRALDETGTALGEVAVALEGFVQAYTHGNSVVLVGSGYYDVPKYTVAIVDLTLPETPGVAAEIAVNITPYYGYWWYGYPYMEGGFGPRDMMGGAAEGKTVAPECYGCYYGYVTERTFLLGHILALRGYSDSASPIFGDSARNEVLALVDLDAEEWTDTLGINFESAVSLDAAGGKLYLGTQEYVEGVASQPRVAYYLRELEVDPPAMGIKANVPGVFVQYAPENGVLTLRDYQWAGDRELQANLQTVLWDGGETVRLVDASALPSWTDQLLGRGGRVYYGSSTEDGYYINSVSVSSVGDLGTVQSVRASGQWGRLYDAQGDDAYVIVGDNAVARYDFGNGGELATVTPFMGYPTAMRFGAESAYLILGYSGVIAVP